MRMIRREEVPFLSEYGTVYVLYNASAREERRNRW